MSLSSLPEPVQRHITSYILHSAPEDVVPLMLVSKAWRAVATDRDMWKDIPIVLHSSRHIRPPSYAGTVFVQGPVAVTAFMSWLIQQRPSIFASSIQITLPNLTALTIEKAHCLRLTPDFINSFPHVLPSLQKFHMNGSDLCTRNIKAFANSLRNLRSLLLHPHPLKPHYVFAAVSNEWVQHLTALTHLSTLSLTNAGEVTNSGIRYIAQMTTLEELEISGAPICHGNNKNYHISTSALQCFSALTRLRVLRLIADTDTNGQRPHCIHFGFLTHTSCLQKLHISDIMLNASSVVQLAMVTRLTELLVNSCKREGSCSFQPLSALTSLQSLTLSYMKLRQADALPDLSGLTRLTLLDLSGGVSFTLTHKLGSFSQMKFLQSLDLSSGNFKTENDLSPLTLLPALLQLQISYLEMARSGMRVIASLTQLTDLRMSAALQEEVDSDGLSKLVKLRVLDASQIGMTAAELQQLSNLTALEWLNLSHNQIGAEGIQYLSYLTNLTHLELRNVGMDCHDMVHLSLLTQLRDLDLMANSKLQESAMIEDLALTSLHRLDLKDTSLVNSNVLQYLTPLTRLRNFCA